jgi:hypothetical protein
MGPAVGCYLLAQTSPVLHPLRHPHLLKNESLSEFKEFHEIIDLKSLNFHEYFLIPVSHTKLNSQLIFILHN